MRYSLSPKGAEALAGSADDDRIALECWAAGGELVPWERSHPTPYGGLADVQTDGDELVLTLNGHAISVRKRPMKKAVRVVKRVQKRARRVRGDRESLHSDSDSDDEFVSSAVTSSLSSGSTTSSDFSIVDVAVKREPRPAPRKRQRRSKLGDLVKHQGSWTKMVSSVTAHIGVIWDSSETQRLVAAVQRHSTAGEVCGCRCVCVCVCCLLIFASLPFALCSFVTPHSLQILRVATVTAGRACSAQPSQTKASR